MANDSWATPQNVYDNMNAEFDFVADMAASDYNHKHDIYWTENDSSLIINWDEHLNGGFVWCNPPYSNISPWVDKAIAAQAQGVGTVMLVMADPSVKWFAKAQKYATETRFVTEGRIAFLNNGVPQSGNEKGSVFFIFAPKMIGTGITKYITRASIIK
tara:strand:+ start:792 stop:1265 length:474 start_codon:yes stop_codon:yes gene_type:complete